MKRILVVMVMLATVAVAPVAAAPANNSTSTTSAATSSTNATALEGGPLRVDGVTSIEGWSYGDGVMHVRVSVDQYKVVTLSGSAERTGRSSSPAYRQVVLQRGESVVVDVPADEVDGSASVSITTSACIQQGTCKTVYSDDGSDAGNPFAAVGPTAGWFGGAGVVMVVISLTVWRRRDRERPDVEGVRD